MTRVGLPRRDDVGCSRSSRLEGFQSGLCWLTILRKRDNFRRAFAGFEFAKIARFGAARVERLLADAGIVRHRGKIEATIHNAKRAVELTDEFGSLAAYFWQFEPAPRAGPSGSPGSARRARHTPASMAMAKDLGRRGWVRRARPPPTRSCRRWAWSMTTSTVATRGRVPTPREVFHRP